MPRRLLLAFLLLLAPAVVQAATLHSEPMDGFNTFPPTAHVSENPHSSPVGCGLPGGSSDLYYESAAYHYFVASGSYVDTPLPPGGCMDIREFWVSWDASWMYLGIQGPNETYERGDLFIAIDTDNLTGPLVKVGSPWGKAVDFCGWAPEFFIALENPASAGGYAALVSKTGATLIDSYTGLQWADGGYNSCDNGGMYYEFRLPLTLLGLQGLPYQQVNFAAYTTYEFDGFDAYDSGPGCGQPGPHEQIGDYPYDSDHCGSNLDCFWGTNDYACGFPESDNNDGPGNPIGGRYPSSDNAGYESDTISEYWAVTVPPTAVEKATWGRIKARYR